MDLSPEMQKLVEENEKARKAHSRDRVNHAMREFIDGLSGNHRLHLSPNPIPRLEKEYPPDRIFFKPATDTIEKPEGGDGDIVLTGFWWGIDGSWADWCLAEQFRGGERYFYKLEMDTSNIRLITNIKEFEDFEDEYLGPPPWHKELGPFLGTMPWRQRDKMSMFGHIDWPRVAEKYAGVEVTPYLWEKRLSSHWYYGWDCASGVLWDINVVKEFGLFAEYSDVTGRFEIRWT